MFVQALAQYADRELSDQLADEAWESKPVPYLIEIGLDGKFLNLVKHTVDVPRGKKMVSVGESLEVPRSPVPRNAGLYPLLAVDDIKYVLGAGPWTAKGQEENNRERHEAFVDLLQRAAKETEDEALEACTRFYERPDQVEKAWAELADTKAGTLVALSVGGPVVKRPAVRAYWREHYRKASAARVADGAGFECLISGRIGPIATTHEKIKGLGGIGGQPSGVSLMSFDKEAFRSYGWDQNANSPVAPDRAMAYVLALNDLLRIRNDRRRRRDIAGIAFVFWTKDFIEDDLMATLIDADQVDRLLRFDPNAKPDSNMFYFAGLAANGARLAIRYWVAETLAQVKANLREWFEGLRVANAFTGEIEKPPRMRQVLLVLHREDVLRRDEKFIDSRVIAVMRRALEGRAQPLGYQMLATVLNRVRVSEKDRMDAVRIGVVRLCLNDLLAQKKGELLMSERLDAENRNPAYLCGRLLAVYESLQYAAHKSGDGTEVNKSVVDRYYSLAMGDPALAFQRLDVLAQKHLAKLRRPDLRGKQIAFIRRIDEICREIGPKFPDQLDLRDQGRFVLGFHHQRAYQMAQAQEYKNKATEAENEEDA